MKPIVLTIILSLYLHPLLAQSVLRGKVIDATNQTPLVGANIQVSADKGTVADNDGAFSIECSGSMTITVSFVGYESTRQSIIDCGTELVISLAPTQQVLNSIQITASSVPNRLLLQQPISVAKLGSLELKRGNGLFLDDAINANIPGVFMQRRTVAAGQQFNIRGYGGGGPGPRGTANNFDGLGVKAYLNGIPITDAEGITLMDDIDFNSIGNIEVVKGPSGSLYGLAIAGVINMQTMRPTKDKVTIGQDAMAGSYGLRRYTTHLQVDEGNSSIILNYGRQFYDGFMNHTSSTKTFINAMGDFRLSDKQNLTTYFGYSNSYDQRNGELTPDQYHNNDFSGNPAYIKNDAHSNVISFRAGIGYNYQFSSKISNTTSLFGTGLNSNVSSAGGWTDKAPMNYGLRSVFDTRFDVGSNLKLSGLTGIETQKQYAQILAYNMVPNANDPTGYNIIGSIRSNQSTISSTYSLFTQWTLTFPGDLSITAGLGSSTMDITLIDKLYVAANNVPGNKVPTTYQTSYKSLLSPSLAINKLINKKISIYASYNKGFRAPVASNIYTPLAGTVNTSLRPENGVQLEIGSKGNLLNEKLYYEVAAFNTQFKDKMTLVAVPNAAGTATAYTYVTNSGGQINNGLEVLLRFTAYQSEQAFTRSVRPFVNYAYSNFTYDHMTFQNNATQAVTDYDGKKVAGVAPHTFNAGVDYVSRPGLYGNITWLFRDSMPFTSDGLNTAYGFSLVNAKIGFRKTVGAFDFDLYAGASNITGVKYYQMVFVNQLPDAFLAGPREVNYFGGLNVKYIF